MKRNNVNFHDFTKQDNEKELIKKLDAILAEMKDQNQIMLGFAERLSKLENKD